MNLQNCTLETSLRSLPIPSTSTSIPSWKAALNSLRQEDIETIGDLVSYHNKNYTKNPKRWCMWRNIGATSYLGIMEIINFFNHTKPKPELKEDMLAACSIALSDFRDKYKSITSADIQTFVLGFMKGWAANHD